MLKLDKLNKSYGNNNILNDITVSFNSGTIYGVIGSNGVGKSTLFRCICGLEDYKGIISYENKKPIKNEIAYLSTEPYFYPKITGREYLNFISKISGNRKSNFTEDFINLFQLPLNTYVDKYSTGMKKKLAFLGTLFLKRSIYILDEPFNGLDLDAVLLFKNIILKLNSENTTIIISSHIVNLLTDICNSILHLEKGVFNHEYFKSTYSEIELNISKNIKTEIDLFF